MAYDEALADRIRTALAGRDAISERKMFGGIGFLHHGNMCAGVWKESLIARVGDADEQYLTEPHVGAFDVTGRPMSGWLLVAAEAVADDVDVERWVDRSLAFTGTLPPK
jgi:TfoX/Sxy family transcriptional regulator of competence genes